MQIRKSRYIESNETCCTRKFNVVLSLCEVLEVTLYFSKDFSEVATRELVIPEVLWPLEVTMVYFLEQKSNL